jgi:hypothetical protein
MKYIVPLIALLTTGMFCFATEPATQPTTVPASWRIIKAGDAFTFAAPPEVKSKEVNGIDSFVGEYHGAGLSIEFDYGWYSNDLKELAKRDGATSRNVTIDGRTAKVVLFDHQVGVYFARVSDYKQNTNKLQLTVDFQAPTTQADALALVRSIHFAVPDKK